MKPLGVIFLLFGMIALIPFKADYLQMWDIPLFTLAGIGALLLLRAGQRIGWRLNLEDNSIVLRQVQSIRKLEKTPFSRICPFTRQDDQGGI